MMADERWVPSTVLGTVSGGSLSLFHPSRSLSGKMLPKLTYCNYALRDGLTLANTFICYQTTQGQHESADRYFFVEGGRAQEAPLLIEARLALNSFSGYGQYGHFLQWWNRLLQ